MESDEPAWPLRGVDVVGQRAAQASALGSLDVALNGGRTDAEALTDLTVAESLRVQTQDFRDPAHR